MSKSLQEPSIQIGGSLFQLCLQGKNRHALIGATPRGSNVRLTRQQLRKPLDIMCFQGGSLPNVNLLPLSLAGSELQVFSWNGQGICLFNLADRLKMGPIISKLSQNRDIVCFQEHGTEPEFLQSFSQWLPGWLIVRSGCFDFQGFPAPGSGGVVTAICRKLRRLCSFEERVIVPGGSMPGCYSLF